MLLIAILFFFGGPDGFDDKRKKRKKKEKKSQIFFVWIFKTFQVQVNSVSFSQPLRAVLPPGAAREALLLGPTTKNLVFILIDHSKKKNSYQCHYYHL